MPLVDPRTDRLVAVWAIRGSQGSIDALYTTSAADLGRWPANQHLGRVLYLHSGTNPTRDLVPVSFDMLQPLNVERRGEEVFGYAWKQAGEGQALWRRLTSTTLDHDSELGHAYLAPETNGDIHSASLVVSRGVNQLRFNLACGGLLHSWEVGGVEILNRANGWNRGLQLGLEWADAEPGRFTLHRPSYSGCRFGSGLGALGSVLLSIAEAETGDGGYAITWETIPLELDPDGLESVEALSTDHGGDQTHPVLWTGLRCRNVLTLDWSGVTGLHRLDTTWTLPFSVQTGWLDCAAHCALCLRGTFDQLVVYDLGLASGTDVSAAADAIDYRRWSVSTLGTFEDEVAVPASATTLASGFGGVYGRNTGSDLTVLLAGRLHPIVAAGDLSLGDVPRGTQVTYLTNRTGGTGLDASQVVLLGLDSNLSSRWYDEDQIRRIPAGSTTFTRWLSIGTLANALSQALAIPAY